MAILLNGTSRYLITPYNAVLVPTTTALTVSAWIMPVAVNAGRIISRHISASTANQIFSLDIASGAVRFAICSFNGVATYTMNRTTSATNAIVTNTWYQVVGTYDGAAVRVYLNGVQAGSLALTSAMVASNTQMSIGAAYNGSSASSYFSGHLEDVRLYTRALSAGEILSNFRTNGTDCSVFGLAFNAGLYENPRSFSMAANATTREIGPFGLTLTTPVAGATYSDGLVRLRRHS